MKQFYYEPNYDTYPLLDNLNIHIRRLFKSGNVKESEDLLEFYSLLNHDINCNYYYEEPEEISDFMIPKYIIMKGYYDAF